MLSSFSLITRNNADHVFIFFFCIFLEFFGFNLINHSIEKKYQNKKKNKERRRGKNPNTWFLVTPLPVTPLRVSLTTENDSEKIP